MTRTQQPKSRRSRPEDAPITPAQMEALTKAAQTQASMHRVDKLSREVLAQRKQAIAAAWKSGASAKQISIALGISLSKTYTLLPKR